MRRSLLCLTLGFLLLAPTSPLAWGDDSAPSADLHRSVAIARDRVYPALVNIGVISRQFVGGRAIRGPGQGSGVIVDPEGHVLTNYHVAQQSTRITCTLITGERIEADVIAHDPLTDLSVLKLKLASRERPGAPVPYAVLGNSDALEVGEPVIALGNPRGLSSSLTQGVVANTSRVFTSFTGSSMRDMALDDGHPTGLFTRWIQHDALIQPGNSGGPLVNLRGEVVGINELGGTGIGFAIPSNLAREVLRRAVDHGRIQRGWLGVTMLPVRALGRTDGGLVGSVQSGHPMDKAGIQAGDILLEVGGEKVEIIQFEDVPRLYARIALMAPGSTQKIVYLRGDERHEVDVVVDEMDSFRGEERVFFRWGLSGMAITPPMAFVRHLPDTRGVLVTGVRPGKPPEVARPSIRNGDVIIGVGEDEIMGLDDFGELQKKYRKTKDLLVRFRRGRNDMVTAFDMTRKPPRRRGSELAKAWLGVETQVMTPEVARALGMKGRKGYRVTWVLPGTEAEKAGLAAGDVITGLDGEALEAWRMQDAQLLRRRVEDMDIGVDATLTVVRDGEQLELPVVLEETPETSEDVKSEEDEVLEYAVRELTYRDKVQRHWPLDTEGVIVSEVVNGGWANVAGLAKGDLLLSIDGNEVRTIKQFEAETKRLAKERPDSVHIFVRRGRGTTFVFVEPEWPRD